MDTTLKQLMEENRQQTAQLKNRDEVILRMQEHIEKLEHQLALLTRMQFGSRSEKFNPDQHALFPELFETHKEEEPKKGKPSKKRDNHGRGKLPEELPRVTKTYKIPQEDRICPTCGRVMTCIGHDCSCQLAFKPSELIVIEHKREKYGCSSGCGDVVLTADRPRWPIEKSLASASLLSYIATAKFLNHMPLYRLEKDFERRGYKLARNTMSGWMKDMAKLLIPLYMLIKDLTLQSHAIWTDDTPVKVQDKTLPNKSRTGRVWTYVGDHDHPYTVYHYTPSRKRDGPKFFLGDYSGYMHADAYGGYDHIYTNGKVMEVACWAHVRRKFEVCLKTNRRLAEEALAHIGRLVGVEKKAEHQAELEAGSKTGEKYHRLLVQYRYQYRQEESKEILANIKQWLTDNKDSVLPKSPMGQAMTYTLNQWDALNTYIEDGWLEWSNNRAERSLRSWAVGRKNWQTFGNDTGGETASILGSLIMSAKLHEIDPGEYLRDVLVRISDMPVNKLEELLPDRWEAKSDASREFQDEEIIMPINGTGK